MRNRDENDYGSGYDHNRNESAGYNQSNDNRNHDWPYRAGDEFRFETGNDEAEHRLRMDQRRADSSTNQYHSANTGYGPGPAFQRSHNYGRFQRYEFGRGNYAVPGLEPGDPNFGKAEYEWTSYGQNRMNNAPIRHEGRYDSNYSQEDHSRGLLDQAGDEIRSWFGDDEAARRRRMDERDSLGNAYMDHRSRNINRSPDYGNDVDHSWERQHNLTRGTGNHDNNWW